MSASSFSRSAPIAIAPKPARFNLQHQSSMAQSIGSDLIHGNMSGMESEGPASPQSGVIGFTCEACRRRGMKCVLDEDENHCASCLTNGLECSLTHPPGLSPTTRKRKQNCKLKDEDFRGGKRRQVTIRIRLPDPFVCGIHLFPCEISIILS